MTDTIQRKDIRRQKTYLAAKASFGDFKYSYDCVVRDRSDTGARLTSPHAREIPGEFHLYCPKEHALRPVRVVWRDGPEIGVVFEGDPVDVRTSTDYRLKRFRVGVTLS